jgi:DUF1009 family protein
MARTWVVEGRRVIVGETGHGTTNMIPRLAEPREGTVIPTKIYAKCDHCGKTIAFDFMSIKPSWFHTDNGGRVCGVPR